MDHYLNLRDAASYIGITVTYLKDRCRAGANGPNYFRPSTRKTMFKRGDLDDWVRSWKTSRDAEVK
jgi:hypothetical protein